MNEHKKIVLNYLKEIYRKNESAAILLFTVFGWQHFGAELPDEVSEAYQKFSNTDDFEVLREFAEWGMKQNESEIYRHSTAEIHK